MPTTIRLTLNDQLQAGMDVLQQRYPFMKPDEILKLALSKLFAEEKTVNSKTKAAKSFSQTMEKLYQAPGGIDFADEQAMTDWWMKNKKELRGG